MNAATSKRLRWSDVSVAAFFGTALGVELMFAAFVLFGRAPVPPQIMTGLTNVGYGYYLPERDIPIYAVGSLIAVIVSLALHRSWRDRAAPSRAAVRLALASVLAFPPLFAIAWRTKNAAAAPDVVVIALLLVPIAWLLAAMKMRASAPRAAEVVGIELPPPACRFSIWEIIFCFALALLLYIPHPAVIAGECFQTDRLHHWDVFAMAASLGFLGGGALGTDIYSQYGVGWPMVFATIFRARGPSYATLFHVVSLYGAIYFVGIYLLLRTWTRHTGWAIGGTLLVLNVQMFTGLAYSAAFQPPLWQWPSSTILRTAMDVWLLLALVAHARSGQARWMFVAGGLAGLAILFGTDTGIYLALGFAAYALFAPRRTWLQVAGATAIGASVCVAGLAIASRGTLLDARFLHGWLEVFSLYPSGISMLPVFDIGGESLAGALVAMFIVGLYLWTIGTSLLRRIELRRLAHPEDTVLLALAVYGSAYFVQYIGRSSPANLSHITVPCMLLLVTALRRMVGSRLPRYVPAIAGAILLLANPHVWRYPNLAHDVFSPPAEGLVPLVPGAGDVLVRPDGDVVAQRYREVIAELRTIQRDGRRFIIFANDDTLFYLYAGATPPGRYSPLLGILLTEPQVMSALMELRAQRPDFILLPDPELGPATMRKSDTFDVQARVRFAATDFGYILDHRVGHLEVWRRAN